LPSFTHGSTAEVLFGGYDLTAFLKTASIDGSADTADTTAFADTAKTYVAGMKDATFSAEGMHDSSANASGTILDTARGVAGTEISYYPNGDTAGNFGSGLEAQVTTFAVNSPVDDVVSVSVEAQSSVGAERVVSLRALSQATTSGTASSLDSGAATTDGYSAYLHVVGAVSGTVSVKIQDSANDSTWADFATFTDITAGTSSQRIEGTADPRRYLRLVTTAASGTATFQCGFSRQPNL
jgi:hypothetical protein